MPCNLFAKTLPSVEICFSSILWAHPTTRIPLGNENRSAGDGFTVTCPTMMIMQCRCQNFQGGVKKNPQIAVILPPPSLWWWHHHTLPAPPLYHHHHHQNQFCRDLRCFVTKSVVSQFTRFSVKFFSWKWCWCQKITNMRYGCKYLQHCKYSLCCK